MKTFDWKNPKIELPKEAAHTDMWWGSQQVLTRTLDPAPRGPERYRYHIAWYNFEWKRFLDYETDRSIDVDEWCELQIFV